MEEQEFVSGDVVWMVCPAGEYLTHGPYLVQSFLGLDEHHLEIYLVYRGEEYTGAMGVELVRDDHYQTWRKAHAN